MQIAVNGIITGLTIAVLAMAFSVVYLSTAGLNIQPIKNFVASSSTIQYFVSYKKINLAQKVSNLLS